MAVVHVDLEMPEDLIQEAARDGLLSQEGITDLIHSAIEKRRIAGFFSAADRIIKTEHAISPEELQSEIQESRRQRRLANASRS
ncbi:MAG: hypothetical protein NTX50_09125 [Candidatus Sumerlaeota bacterium]|nr:hypothetical protein [Candidatus Sumerlaeota bacterium]